MQTDFSSRRFSRRSFFASPERALRICLFVVCGVLPLLLAACNSAKPEEAAATPKPPEQNAAGTAPAHGGAGSAARAEAAKMRAEDK